MKRFLLGLAAHAATAVVTFCIVIVYLGCGKADIIVNSIEVPKSVFGEKREGVFISRTAVSIRGRDDGMIVLSTVNDDPLVSLTDSKGKTYKVDLEEMRGRRGI